jgi:transcriptional regulator with XRE-family HTH domain
MNTLKDRLKEARKAAGYSQAALADLAKCGQTTIASIENGRNQGSTVLARLAEILGVEPLWLSEGRGCKKRGEIDAAIGTNVERIKPKSAHESRIDEIVTLLRSTSMEGLAVILDRAKDAAREYPLAKQTRASSG